MVLEGHIEIRDPLIEGDIQTKEGDPLTEEDTMMEDPLDGDEEINLIKDVRARSNVCYKYGEVGHFQRDCKYDGDKPTDNQQA